MKGIVAVCCGVALLSGCTRQASQTYYPGQLFGNGGKTACVAANGSPIRCTVDGGVPWCPPPNDGDEWDTRNQVVQIPSARSY